MSKYSAVAVLDNFDAFSKSILDYNSFKPLQLTVPVLYIVKEICRRSLFMPLIDQTRRHLSENNPVSQFIGAFRTCTCTCSVDYTVVGADVLYLAPVDLFTFGRAVRVRAAVRRRLLTGEALNITESRK